MKAVIFGAVIGIVNIAFAQPLSLNEKSLQVGRHTSVNRDPFVTCVLNIVKSKVLKHYNLSLVGCSRIEPDPGYCGALDAQTTGDLASLFFIFGAKQSNDIGFYKLTFQSVDKNGWFYKLSDEDEYYPFSNKVSPTAELVLIKVNGQTTFPKNTDVDISSCK